MTDYTKTTDFTAKDSLPSGNANKKITGALFDTEFDSIATAIATKSNTASPTFTGTVTTPTLAVTTLKANDGTSAGSIADSTGVVTIASAVLTTADINGGTFDGVVGGTTPAAVTGTTLVANTSLALATGATVTGIADEDTMSSDSATLLATQQSIKAYVDAQQDTVDTWAEVLALGNTSGATDAVIDAGQALTTNTINETTAASGVTIDSVLLKDNTVLAGTLLLGAGSVTDSSGAISFGNENLTTTGTLAAGATTVNGNILSGNSVTNPASGFADQEGLGWNITTKVLEISSDATALSVGRTTTGGAGNIVTLRDQATIVTSFGTAVNATSANTIIGSTSVTPDSTLHVHTASAGAVAGNTNADDLVVENSGNGGISILAPDTDNAQLYFGSPTNNASAIVRFNYNDSLFTLASNNVGDSLVLKGDAFVTNLTLSGASGSESTVAAGSLTVTDFLGVGSPSELTIATGVVTATASYHKIDTEANASSDDLDTINGGSAGRILYIHPAASSRTVVVKHETGNIQLTGQADLNMNDDADTIQLLFNATTSTWVQVGGGDNDT